MPTQAGKWAQVYDKMVPIIIILVSFILYVSQKLIQREMICFQRKAHKTYSPENLFHLDLP